MIADIIEHLSSGQRLADRQFVFHLAADHGGRGVHLRAPDLAPRPTNHEPEGRHWRCRWHWHWRWH